MIPEPLPVCSEGFMITDDNCDHLFIMLKWQQTSLHRYKETKKEKNWNFAGCRWGELTVAFIFKLAELWKFGCWHVCNKLLLRIKFNSTLPRFSNDWLWHVILPCKLSCTDSTAESGCGYSRELAVTCKRVRQRCGWMAAGGARVSAAAATGCSDRSVILNRVVARRRALSC